MDNYNIITILLFLILTILFYKQFNNSRMISQVIKTDLVKNKDIYLPLLLRPTNIIFLYIFENYYKTVKNIFKYNIHSYVSTNQTKLLNSIRANIDWLTLLNGVSSNILDSLSKTKINKIKALNHTSINNMHSYLCTSMKLNKIEYNISKEQLNKIMKKYLRKSKYRNVLIVNKTIILLFRIHLLIKIIINKYSPYDYIVNKNKKSSIDRKITRIILTKFDKTKSEFYELNKLINAKLDKKYMSNNDSPLYRYYDYITEL